MPLAQAKFRSVDSATIPKKSRFRQGLHHPVPRQYLLRDRLAFIELRKRGEKVIGTEIPAFNHSAAAHDVAGSWSFGSVKAAADLFRFFKDRYVLTGKISVTNEESRRWLEAIPPPTR